MYQKFIAKFNNISFSIISVIAVVLPFFFFSVSWGGFGGAKALVLYAGTFLAFSFWLLAQFVEGSIKIPKHRVLLALALWVFFVLLSAILSPVSQLSLWGRGFSFDSFATTFVLAILAFLVAIFSSEQRRLVKLFLATFLGSVVTVFLQVLLYVSQNISFVKTYLANVANQGTLVGTWVDFAYFVTCTFVVALLMHEVLRPKGFFKFLSFFAMILSLVVLVFLNFKIAWVIATISALVVFVYESSVERSLSRMFAFPSADTHGGITPPGGEEAQTTQARFPAMSFVALLLGVFFFLSSSSVGVLLSRYAGVTFTDIRPSFGATTTVLRQSIVHDPLFGAGPGRFVDTWNLYRPIEVNTTGFWGTPFDSGFSMVQTQAITNGLLATFALLAILVFSILHGFKLFNSQFPDRFSRFIAVTSLVLLIAFAILFICAAPGIVLVTYAFIYIGLLVGVSVLVGKTKLTTIQYLRDPRLSFFAILLVVVATIVSFSAVFFSASRFASIVYFSRALVALDSDTATVRLNRALFLSENDTFWATRTNLFMTRFAQELQVETPDKTKLQAYFSQAEQSANAAVKWNRESAENWLLLGRVYQMVAAQKAEGAYDSAKNAVLESQKRNPQSPLPFLALANLAITQQDMTGAIEHIDKALALKQNYLDAYILRGQIRVGQGVTSGLKEELIAYTKLAPFDAQGYTLLAQAEINLKEYQNALSALQQARAIEPSNPALVVGYVNVLITMGQRTQAIEELKAFKTAFPAATGVDEQIERLQKELQEQSVPKK